MAYRYERRSVRIICTGVRYNNITEPSTPHSNGLAGYTLVELVMVTAMVAILSMWVAPNLLNLTDEARTAVTKERMQALKRGITGDGRVIAGNTYASPGFEADMNRLPTALSELITQGGMTAYNPLTRVGWRGPYVDNNDLNIYNKDGWGTTLEYSEGSRYLRSWGPNLTDDSGASDDITLTF